jgi:hypothetical protein
MWHGRTRDFSVERRFDAADAADGWLDHQREAGAKRTAGAPVGGRLGRHLQAAGLPHPLGERLVLLSTNMVRI